MSALPRETCFRSACAILSGFAISRLGELGEKINNVIDAMAQVFFGIIRIIRKGRADRSARRDGIHRGAPALSSLVNLLELIATLYLTSLLFVLVVSAPCAARGLSASIMPG